MSRNFIFPFMYTPWHDKEKPYQVWSVNEDEPETTNGYIQGYWECTRCGKGNQFRFYDDGPEYQAKCPDCRKDFIAVEPEWDEEDDYEDL